MHVVGASCWCESVLACMRARQQRLRLTCAELPAHVHEEAAPSGAGRMLRWRGLNDTSLLTALSTSCHRAASLIWAALPLAVQAGGEPRRSHSGCCMLRGCHRCMRPSAERGPVHMKPCIGTAETGCTRVALHLRQRQRQARLNLQEAQSFPCTHVKPLDVIRGH